MCSDAHSITLRNTKVD